MEPINHTVAGFPYKEYAIPKKNGKVRRIFAPGEALLDYQQGELPMLTTLLHRKEAEYGVRNILQGFIPGRSCITAAKKHIGFEHTIMMDISAFFDNVRPEHLPATFRDACYFHTDPDGTKFTAQGYATSPMLANIAILPVVQQIKSYLTGLFGSDYAFTIYADDIQASFNGEFIDTSKRIIDMVTILFNLQGFSINQSKTRIRHSKFGYRRILGVNVGTDHIRASRKTIRKLRAARHQENWPSAGGLTCWRNQCTLNQ